MSKQKEIYTLEFWEAKGYSKEESLLEIKKEKRKNHFLCNEYWIERGYNIDESKEKIRQIQLKNARKVNQKNKKNPYSIKYWIELGKTENEAKEEIKKLKEKTNPYKNWDKEKFKNIIQKRRETYYSKSKKEKEKINKTRGRTTEQLIQKFGEERTMEILKQRGRGRTNPFFRRYSKISKSFFNELQSRISQKLYYGEEEKWIRYNKNKGFYVDLILDNKIIEFNGDFYHANPNLYDGDAIIKISSSKIFNAKDIWSKDTFKVKTLEKLGYKILIIWEKDIREDRDKILNKCIKFLKDEH
jgi:hypothetical protein